MDKEDTCEGLGYYGKVRYVVAKSYICTLGQAADSSGNIFEPPMIEKAENTHKTSQLEGNTLTLRRGYFFDGASFPRAFRVVLRMCRWLKSFRRAAAEHDALYEFMRLESLDRDSDREYADAWFYDRAIQDSATKWVARIALWALKRWGYDATLPSAKRKKHCAP